MKKRVSAVAKTYLLSSVFIIIILMITVGQLSATLTSISVQLPGRFYGDYSETGVDCAVSRSGLMPIDGKGLGWPILQDIPPESAFPSDPTSCWYPGAQSVEAKYINIGIGVGLAGAMLLLLIHTSNKHKKIV